MDSICTKLAKNEKIFSFDIFYNAAKQPRMLVDEAKRKQLRGGWKKTELTKDLNQVTTKQISTKKITIMIT